MEARAILRTARISPQKARLVADQVRGMAVGRAEQLLTFSPKKAAGMIRKVLLSAVSNAENNLGADVDELKVQTICVDEGPQLKRLREDEQAFAELNAANPIFVEDAARLFCEQLRADPRIGDFRVVASHQESLHSHDAVSVLCDGKLFAASSMDPRLFATLAHGN